MPTSLLVAAGVASFSAVHWAWIDQHHGAWLRWTAAALTLALFAMGLFYRVAGGRNWPRRLDWLMRPWRPSRDAWLLMAVVCLIVLRLVTG